MKIFLGMFVKNKQIVLPERLFEHFYPSVEKE